MVKELMGFHKISAHSFYPRENIITWFDNCDGFKCLSLFEIRWLMLLLLFENTFRCESLEVS